MKKMFKYVAIASMAVVAMACAKETDDVKNDQEKVYSFTAVYPNVESDTKTELIGKVAGWSPQDQIGAMGVNVDLGLLGELTGGLVNALLRINVPFTNTNTQPSVSANFENLLGNVQELLSIGGLTETVAYYPYSTTVEDMSDEALLGLDLHFDVGIRVGFPTTQYPTATSFDGNADILMTDEFSKELLSLDLIGTMDDVYFRRLGGILKVVLVDNTTGQVITGNNVVSMSVSVDEGPGLTGDVYIDVNKTEYSDNGLSELIEDTEVMSATAQYDATTMYAIGDNVLDDNVATYLGVYPQTLEAGTTLTVTAITNDGMLVEKEITLPSDISIIPGRLTRLNVGISDANL